MKREAEGDDSKVFNSCSVWQSFSLERVDWKRNLKNVKKQLQIYLNLWAYPRAQMAYLCLTRRSTSFASTYLRRRFICNSARRVCLDGSFIKFEKNSLNGHTVLPKLSISHWGLLEKKWLTKVTIYNYKILQPNSDKAKELPAAKNMLNLITSFENTMPEEPFC